MSPKIGSVIGVDIGTQSTKAVLVAADGTILAQAQHGYAPDTPRPNWAEQHADVWLDAVERCIAEVARSRDDVVASASQASMAAPASRSTLTSTHFTPA